MYILSSAFSSVIFSPATSFLCKQPILHLHLIHSTVSLWCHRLSAWNNIWKLHLKWIFFKTTTQTFALFGLKSFNTAILYNKLAVCPASPPLVFFLTLLLPVLLLLRLSLCQMEQPSMDQKGHANVPWIVEPGQEAKRGVNTKYETTIF